MEQRFHRAARPGRARAVRGRRDVESVTAYSVRFGRML
jgi:hypothetical protein